MTTDKEAQTNVRLLTAPARSQKIVRNYELVVETVSGKSQETKVGLSGAEIHGMLNSAVDGWPKRIGSSLFILADDRHRFVQSPSEFFGWLANKGVTYDWIDRGMCVLSKSEFLAYLTHTAEAFETISNLPHFPPRERCFYYGEPLPDVGEEVLDEFLGFFNPATETDRCLLKAAFMTLFWGAGGGARPAFVLSAEDDETDKLAGRGVGKTTLTDLMGELAGGILEVGKDDKADDVKRRLLTSTVERIVRFDNVKGSKFSSADFEALITAPFVSGHRLYKGNQAVPNLFTYVFTFNDAAFSKDMAQRAILVRLKRPDYTDNWKDKVESFLKNQRLGIIAGIKAAFDRVPAETDTYLRFGKWTKEVLLRTGPAAIVHEIKQAQDEVDRDDQDGDEVAGAVDTVLGAYELVLPSGRNEDGEVTGQTIIIKRAILHDGVLKALGLKCDARAVPHLLKRARVPRIAGVITRHGHRYYVVKGQVHCSDKNGTQVQCGALNQTGYVIRKASRDDKWVRETMAVGQVGAL